MESPPIFSCFHNADRRHQNLHPPPEDDGWHDVPAVANAESPRSTSADPQAGHSTWLVESDFCNFSKLFPHPLQVNSKIGTTRTSIWIFKFLNVITYRLVYVNSLEPFSEAGGDPERWQRLIPVRAKEAALLNFSSAARFHVRRRMVDLFALAEEVAAELAFAEPARRVKFKIADGPPIITADPITSPPPGGGGTG